MSIEDDARWAGMTGRTIRDARTVYIQTQAGTLHKAYEQIVEGKRGPDPVVDKVYVDVETRRDRRGPSADPLRAQPQRRTARTTAPRCRAR